MTENLISVSQNVFIHCWYIAAYLGMLPPPVGHWKSVTPLAGLYIN